MTSLKAMAAVLVTSLALPACAASLSRKYSRYVLLPRRSDIASPAALRVRHRVVRFRNEGGKRLRGWFLPSKRSRAAVLFFCGNSGNVSYHLLYARFLVRAGFNVLLFDYQGFGRSGGRIDVRSLAGDGQAALDWLRKQPGVDAKRIGLYGVSLGSVVALGVAADNPGTAAVVAEAPYEPARELARGLRSQRGRSPGVARLLGSLAQAAFPWFFNPHASVDRLTGVPLFFIHGERDRLLRPNASLRLFLRATGPKRLWLPARTGHAPELLVTHDGEYQAQIVGFFRRWLAGGRALGQKGLAWRVVDYRDGSFEVKLSPRSTSPRPSPVEIVTISRGGARFQRFRRWLRPGRAVVLRPRERPVGIAITPYHGEVRAGFVGWKRVPSDYTRSYRALNRTRTRVRRALRRGADGLAEVARLLRALDAKRLEARIAPQLGAWFARLGRRLERANRPTDAIAAYARALALAPKGRGLYYTLGDARFSWGAPGYPRWVARRLRWLRAQQAPRATPEKRRRVPAGPSSGPSRK